MRRLRWGIFLAPFHAITENATTTLDRDMELIELLDRFGYNEAWIGEHHSGGFEIIASPELFIAAAAERTKYIKLGTGVVSLPYHSPMMVAERLTQLDHMTRGRTMLGVGSGALVSDAMMFGVERVDQRRRSRPLSSKPAFVLSRASAARLRGRRERTGRGVSPRPSRQQ